MRSFCDVAMRNWVARFVMVVYLSFVLWWLSLHFPMRASSEALQLWDVFYQAIALYGAILGLKVSKQWGGLGSIIGRAIIAFSCGLLLQSFGQSAYSFYIYYLNEPVPYPSIGDIGFFGSIPLYLYGALMLARASGAQVSLRTYYNKIVAALMPLILLGFSYWMFLRDYTFDWSQPIKIVLDFGYPLGQAVYVSLAILAFILSRKILGGIMRGPILTFIFALVAQYISDFTFLYQANHGLWYAGGINDLMYATSYLLMAISLIYIGNVFRHIQNLSQ